MFALGGLSRCGTDVPTFDGTLAFQYLVRQCEFGSRVPGTKAHADCLGYLTAQLQQFGAQVSHQTFEEKLGNADTLTTLTNLIASFGPDRSQRILLCAHWDSRPRADQDDEPGKRAEPVPGANDGASGVAVLLEVARHLQMRQPEFGIDIILFDGEDAGISGDPDTYAIGSQYFASNKDPSYRPQFGILLDMVGDKDLQLYQEVNSLRLAPHIVNKVWGRAKELELNAFHPTSRYEVTDDHLPLLRAGIPCVDLIDFDYEFWHTTEDTPNKCSPESLAQVGQLLLSLIYDN